MCHDGITLTGLGELLGMVEHEIKRRDSRVAGIKCDYTGQGLRFHMEVILRAEGEREVLLPVSIPFGQFVGGDVRAAASKILWAVEHGARVEFPGEKTFKITS